MTRRGLTLLCHEERRLPGRLSFSFHHDFSAFVDIDTLRGWGAETAPAEVIPRGGDVGGLRTLNGSGIIPEEILYTRKLPVLIDVTLL